MASAFPIARILRYAFISDTVLSTKSSWEKADSVTPSKGRWAMIGEAAVCAAAKFFTSFSQDPAVPAGAFSCFWSGFRVYAADSFWFCVCSAAPVLPCSLSFRSSLSLALVTAVSLSKRQSQTKGLYSP